jgi:hypothetical protein
MYTHAYERFEQNGYTYELPSTDTSSMTKVLEQNEVSLGETTTASIEKSGKYVLEAEISADGNELAQITIKVSINNRGACSLVTHGTNGKKAVIKAPLSLMQGDCNIMFETSSDKLTIYSFSIFK